MFNTDPTPRVFAQAPGVDFPRAVVDGLFARLQGQPPEAMARVTLIVNTARMRRRIIELFDQGQPTFLPKILLVTDLDQLAPFVDVPKGVSSLRRRLELSELVAQLLDRQPDLAPRHAIYALADSLANLLGEMQSEDVAPGALDTLDVENHSGYWQRNRAFLSLVEDFFGEGSSEPPDSEGRQRIILAALEALWTVAPPADPIIIAGSTGSRGVTFDLMKIVSNLPQGAIILPGFDADMPTHVWNNMGGNLTAEDHPQYRFRKLMTGLDIGPGDIRDWHATPAPVPRRNALVSLALRPAPVTDQWHEEGPSFQGVDTACEQVTLIEAPSPRKEALAIALVLREAAETGRDAALISPDRNLTRQVSAALDRWNITPDDSAGRPLALSPPGRLLRHVSDMRGRKVTNVDLLTLLKHPLVHSGHNRGDHLRLTRDLELQALRKDMPFPDEPSLTIWAGEDELRQNWVRWIVSVLAEFLHSGRPPLIHHVDHLVATTERLCAGSGAEGSGGLWDKEAGIAAQGLVRDLTTEAPHGGEMTCAEFRDLLAGIMNAVEVRDPIEAHPNIRIWGTLEARVQGVDLVILAGLNEGTWPSLPSPDPWMNRQMRDQVGLLLPERRIGLSAHDFQQAIGAREAILSRSIRSDEAETVPSRWINRLTNLLSGVSGDGKDALKQMRARGQAWLELAEQVEAPVTGLHTRPISKRPSPQPPIEARPNKLSFTDMARLIRDPYAIYARRILGLSPLDPLHKSPDAPLRGTAIHEVMERFVCEAPGDESLEDAKERLLTTASEVFAGHAPWPAARLLWLAALHRVADSFLADEEARQSVLSKTWVEQWGEATFADPPFTLYGKADRIDRLNDGRLAIFDYKTGAPPTAAQQKAYDKQLLLEALVAEAGGFDKIGKARVASTAYIGLGSSAGEAAVEVDAALLGQLRGELETIIDDFRQRGRGYTSRRVVFKSNDRFAGDYDHLARFGEWDQADAPTPEEVGS